MAGDEQSVAGGIDFATSIQVAGTVNVRSCCGFSTNDIDFRIRGADYYGEGGSFGVIVGSFSFEWNSGQDYQYELIFDNEWIVCGGTPFTCTGNETSPSYHNKNVELNVREAAPLIPYLSMIFRLFWPLMVVVSIPIVVGVFVRLRKRRQEKSDSS